MRVRRVVSGQDQRGKAVIVSDEILESMGGGATSGVGIWGADEPPRFPLNGQLPSASTIFPVLGGYRFACMIIQPDSDNRSHMGGAVPSASVAAQASEFEDIFERDAPGMHTTDTIDFEVVISGEASLELDDGVKVHLKPGDTFVQNGTRHRWFNRGSVPAVVAVVMIGGHPRRQS